MTAACAGAESDSLALQAAAAERTRELADTRARLDEATVAAEEASRSAAQQVSETNRGDGREEWSQSEQIIGQGHHATEKRARA